MLGNSPNTKPRFMRGSFNEWEVRKRNLGLTPLDPNMKNHLKIVNASDSEIELISPESVMTQINSAKQNVGGATDSETMFSIFGFLRDIGIEMHGTQQVFLHIIKSDLSDVVYYPGRIWSCTGEYGVYEEFIIEIPFPDLIRTTQIQMCTVKEMPSVLTRTHIPIIHTYFYGTELKRLQEEYKEAYQLWTL